jgi:hypothetical protein
LSGDGSKARTLCLQNDKHANDIYLRYGECMGNLSAPRKASGNTLSTEASLDRRRANFTACSFCPRKRGCAKAPSPSHRCELEKKGYCGLPDELFGVLVLVSLLLPLLELVLFCKVVLLL